jgi:TP901 family phage tail tape measure protein
MSLTPVGDLGIALKADIDDYQKSMATASDISRGLGGAIRGLGRAMRNTGLAMTAASGIAGAAMMTLTQRAQRVNSAFREVDTISDEVSDAQAEYGQLVTDLNTQFGIQANRMEVIDGLYQSVSAGVTEGAEAQREFLETSARLAVVSRVDLATSVDVLSTVMNTYGMETDMAEDVSESLFQTVQFGKVRMEELAPVLGRVAALGSDMSVRIDEIGTAMAVLTRTGFRARVAATGLRNIFRAMMRPSETMKELLRDIALESDDISQMWNEQSEMGDNLAQTYRDTAKAVRNLEDAQSSARRTVEENSLAIQEARLKIQAIEQDRVDEIENLTNSKVKEADTIEDLQTLIEDYRFKTNEARVEEEQHRLELEKKQNLLQDLRNDFRENVDVTGNLENSVGNLVLQDQNFVETLVELRKRAREQNIAFNELFPRTRALQGALALVGEDGQLLVDIFDQMQDPVFDVQNAWDEHEESLRENFDSFEAFKNSTQELQGADLKDLFEEATGPQQEMRNAASRLSEAAGSLGQVFSEDVTEAISNFASVLDTAATKFENMRDSIRSGISRFAVLAVSIGLVLGPLLFFTGQLALIGSVMGAAFIPFLVIAAGLFGVFAAGLQSAVSGGEQANSLFTRMSDIFGRLISFLTKGYTLFKLLVLPELIEFGRAVASVFGIIGGNMKDVIGGGGDSITILNKLFGVMASSLTSLTQFISKNEDVIATLITLAVDIILNHAIPAFLAFAKGIWAVIAGVDWSQFIPIAKMIARVAVVIFGVVGAIGRWMQRNNQLIATLIKWGLIIGGIIATVLTLVTGLGILVTTLSSVWATLQTIIVIVGIAIQIMGPLNALVTILAANFPMLAAGISTLLSPIGLVIAAIVLLGVAWYKNWFNMRQIVATSLDFILSGMKLMVSAITLLPRLMVAFFRDGFSGVEGVLQEFFSNFINVFFNKGIAMVKALAKGLIGSHPHIRAAMETVMGIIDSYLPSSPAEKGPFSDMAPEDFGAKITTDFASGMESKIGKVSTSSENLTKSAVPKAGDIEGRIDKEAALDSVGSTRRSDMAKQGKTKIIIEEGAVDVGPFEGISDEELPAKVEEEVDRSLDEIIEDIRSAGYEPN